ncbi:MAG: phytanoyl-CoA dioxygenase family protein [Hyphomicrobiales bacterium]|nr:phytanoyl-CoA dioxygenase family protein [Hyphomicrobiales bacterium]
MPNLTMLANDLEDQECLRQFDRDGYAVVRGVFSSPEVEELRAAFDRVYAEALKHPRSYRHGNTLFRVAEDQRVGRIVRYVQWPSYFEPVLDRFRRDPRMYRIVSAFVGQNVKQIINQMHWKPPGAAAEFGYHQDIRFRRPRTAYRDPATSYVQTGIAVDAHREENGAMTVLPGSHRLNELDFSGQQRVMDRAPLLQDLNIAGLGHSAQAVLELDPGDVAIWHLFLVHGSGANRSSTDRRFYINGYVRAANCDRGEWVFRHGRSVSLGAPVLVHYEDLYRRPEPHYVDD